ncbi:MAG: hypothetical protein KRP56_03055 [Candidatus Methanogranum gryphiswaldense]|nr:MAG: hypothetical protein KRP56_03055 [Candidatus Methanogranum sp. U3.2.1]
MIHPSDGRAVYEFEEVDGIVNFVESQTISCEHTPISRIPKDRTDVWDYYSAHCWKLPAKINPHQDWSGIYINHENPEMILGWISEITGKILRLLDRSMYFKDERHPALIVNFIFNTYLKDAFDYAPRIILTGGTDSGKSRLLEILGELSYHGFLIVRPTFAIMFRMIDAYNTTPIIDEAQRLREDARRDLEDIFLSGTQKDAMIPRCNNNSLKPETFKVYSPLVMSNKAGTFTAEDIENRGFRINLIPNRIKKIDPLLDKDGFLEIRTELYSLRALYKMHPECFGLKDLIKEAIHELTETDDQGNMITDFIRTDGERGRLKNRSLQIAITYYTLSKLTGTESDILSLLTEEDRNNMERNKDTKEGAVFRAYIQCCKDKSEDYPLYGYLDIMTSVSSKEIQEKYNLNLLESGNQKTTLDQITANSVSRTMKDISLEMSYDAGKGRGGHRNGVKIVKNLDEYIYMNEDRYATEIESEILRDLHSRRSLKKLTSKLTDNEKLAES